MSTGEALLSLGSNLGDRRALIDAAVARLAALPKTILRARSSYYRTAPVGPVEQEWFLNIAVALRTGQSRAGLAAICHMIEADLGRDRSREISWGPRPIDIDVVAFGADETIDLRSFVLVPLAEIAPESLVEGRTIAELALEAGSDGVEKLDWAVPVIA